MKRKEKKGKKTRGKEKGGDPPRFYRDRRIGQNGRPADRSGSDSKKVIIVSSTQETPPSLRFVFILADLFASLSCSAHSPFRSNNRYTGIQYMEKKGHRHRGRHKHTK